MGEYNAQSLCLKRGEGRTCKQYMYFPSLLYTIREQDLCLTL